MAQAAVFVAEQNDLFYRCHRRLDRVSKSAAIKGSPIMQNKGSEATPDGAIFSYLSFKSIKLS